jgi:broad specificity phosphatase PhoE
MELSWGEWEGLPRAEAEPLLQAQLRKWAEGDRDWAPPKGESLQAFQRRLQAGYELLLSLFPTGPLLIISHGYSLRVLLSWLLGYSPAWEGMRFHHAPGRLSWGIRNPNGVFYLQSLAISPDDWVF